MGTARKTYYGVTLGILVVETYFRRFVGDIGNAETWPFPVQYKIVRGAVPARMVALGEGSLLEPFKQAAQELIADGVDGITTTCGFLSLYQPALAAALSVPVATSALLQAPMAGRILPQGKRVGILTYDAQALTAAHLAAVGVDAATPVVGLPPGSEFRRAIREGDPSVPYDEWEAEVLDAAGQLLAAYPETGAIICECTNLTPFSAAIAERYGVAVFDAVTLVHWFYHGLRPRRFPRG